MGERTIIAGLLPNTPQNMEAWLENPQAIVPGNAMPNMELTDNEAKDFSSLCLFTRCAKAARDKCAGLAFAGAALLSAVALISLPGSAIPQPAEAPQHLPVAPASAAPADDGQWTMPTKNYAATRYSSLDQINGENVKNLRVEFTFSTGTLHGEEAAPIVVNNTMYIVTPWPNIVYALDLTKPGAPMKWKYEPPKIPAAQGVACCDTVNRGGVFSDNMWMFSWVHLDG